MSKSCLSHKFVVWVPWAFTKQHVPFDRDFGCPRSEKETAKKRSQLVAKLEAASSFMSL